MTTGYRSLLNPVRLGLMGIATAFVGLMLSLVLDPISNAVSLWAGWDPTSDIEPFYRLGLHVLVRVAGLLVAFVLLPRLLPWKVSRLETLQLCNPLTLGLGYVVFLSVAPQDVRYGFWSTNTFVIVVGLSWLLVAAAAWSQTKRQRPNR